MFKPGPKKGAKYARRKKLIKKKCPVCGRGFEGVLARGIYCGDRCESTAAKRRQRAKKK